MAYGGRGLTLMGETAAIILARGGSKGIPRKNLVDLCGKPLLVWSIESALASREVMSVWVSSEDKEILEVARGAGAQIIERPDDLASDSASSEAGWLHAVGEVERRSGPLGLVVGLQATSPLREGADIDKAVADYRAQGCNSLLSVEAVDDFLVWVPDAETGYTSLNYDFRNRGRRQDRQHQYHENGSIYVFPPGILREYGNRLSGRIGISVMPGWKSFQIDGPDDLILCEAVMRRFMPTGR